MIMPLILQQSTQTKFLLLLVDVQIQGKVSLKQYQFLSSYISEKATKGNRILRYGCRAFDTFWVPDDIESCNFQNLLIFGFHETSQNLMSFRQLLFSLFHGGDQRKKSENPRKVSNVRHPYLRILFPFLIFDEKQLPKKFYSTYLQISLVPCS